MNSSSADRPQQDVGRTPDTPSTSPTENGLADTIGYSDAVKAWASYCLIFGRAPNTVLGMRYPGHENYPMTHDMARDVERLIVEASLQGPVDE